jgi:hypothetical protein
VAFLTTAAPIWNNWATGRVRRHQFEYNRTWPAENFRTPWATAGRAAGRSLSAGSRIRGAGFRSEFPSCSSSRPRKRIRRTCSPRSAGRRSRAQRPPRRDLRGRAPRGLRSVRYAVNVEAEEGRLDRLNASSSGLGMTPKVHDWRKRRPHPRLPQPRRLPLEPLPVLLPRPAADRRANHGLCHELPSRAREWRVNETRNGRD